MRQIVDKGNDINNKHNRFKTHIFLGRDLSI